MTEFNPLRDAVPLDAVRRVLVIKLRHHGDVLLSSPVFSVLKAAAPHVEIDALVYTDTADMLTGHPAIAQVHGIDRQWKRRGPLGHLQAELGLFQTLKARQYDLVIHLTEHWRGAWLCRLLKPRWSVGPAVPGRNTRWKRSFTHLQASPAHALRHTVEANLDALRRIGLQPGRHERKLTLIPGPAAEAAMAQRLAAAGLTPGRFIHIHPASRWLFKCWTVGGMATVIEGLRAQGHTIILSAAPSPQEQGMIDAIQARLSTPVASFSGNLTLKELAALTRAAQLFIGVDSAPMHMAAAVGTPTVALFGPSGDRQWGPWGVPSRVITSTAHPCRPCGLDGCGGGKVSDCLRIIEAREVLDAAFAVLAETESPAP